MHKNSVKAEKGIKKILAGFNFGDIKKKEKKE